MKRLHLEFTDDTGPEWVAAYYLGYNEYDDEPNSEDSFEIQFIAKDFETAVKYAQQFLRKQKSEKDSWESAELLSVSRY